MTVHLPLIAERKRALETCVYCPKLCRGACPVSNADPTESLTPWGKMSAAFFVARGNVKDDAAFSETAWACTGCHACRELCDHKNDVVGTLLDARRDAFERGTAPAAARAVKTGFDERLREAGEAARSIARGRSGAKAAVMIGCTYLLHANEEARAAHAVAEALLGEPASVVEPCCGLPLLEAGDRAGFVRAAERFARAVEDRASLVAVDPGCARAILVEYPRHGVAVKQPTLLVDLAARSLDRFARVEDAAPPRYHDPCQLGRGLGRFDEPRAVLGKIAGGPPREFARSREGSECSGGGSLLPVVYPETSQAIASARIGAHRDEGGGTLVTACASSLLRFRSAGEPAEDLSTWLLRGLGIPPRGP
jgi:Fe-S oxidoreductase